MNPVSDKSISRVEMLTKYEHQSVSKGSASIHYTLGTGSVSGRNRKCRKKARCHPYPQKTWYRNSTQRLESKTPAFIVNSSPSTSDFSELVGILRRSVRLSDDLLFQPFLNKAKVEARGKKYFVDHLPLILNHCQILGECPFFRIPISLKDGKAYKEIKTEVCSNSEKINDILMSLEDNELAFIVYYQDNENQLKIKLSLFSNESGEAEIDDMIGGFLGSGLEFFGMSFTLSFDPNGELITISLARGVNEKFQKNRICSSVSIEVLKKIYEHLGSEITKMNSCSASHIGTVKFYYPLNSFYRKNSFKSLRDFDPRNSPLTLVEVEKRQESLDAFKMRGIKAKCPDRQINLEKLLLQYQVRDALMKAMEST